MMSNNQGASWARIGLTGGIATGKSTLSSYLKDLAYPVIDADLTAHALMGKGAPLTQALLDHFGPSIGDGRGGLDRARLGQKVFNNPDALQALNQISHPVILQSLLDQAEALEEGRPGAIIGWDHKDLNLDQSLVFFDVPLLLEDSTLRGKLGLDEVWLVYAPEEIELDRLVKRDGLGRDEAKARIKSQMSIKDKKNLADVLIYNQFDRADLYKQADRELARWKGLVD